MIVKRTLPHGKVSSSNLKDSDTRDAVMRISENVSSLASQLSELQSACQSMERDVKAALVKIAALEASAV